MKIFGETCTRKSIVAPAKQLVARYDAPVLQLIFALDKHEYEDGARFAKMSWLKFVFIYDSPAKYNSNLNSIRELNTIVWSAYGFIIVKVIVYSVAVVRIDVTLELYFRRFVVVAMPASVATESPVIDDDVKLVGAARIGG